MNCDSILDCGRRRGVDNVVFDLGGVVIDLRRDNAVEALRELGLADAGDLLGLYRQEGPFLDLETGRISPAGFFDLLRPHCRPGTTDTDIQTAFCRFLTALPAERLAALRALRARGKRLYALSNTNAVMYHSWIAEAFRAEGLCIDDYFDGIVTSFEQGACKPDPAIFEALLRRYGLDPAATLFLDDSEANCRAARGCGLRSAVVGAPGSDTDMLHIVARIEAGGI